MNPTTTMTSRGSRNPAAAHPEPIPTSSGRALARAAAALLVLVGVMVGVPAALLFLAGQLDQYLVGITPDLLARPDDGRLLILLAFAVGWAAWAVCAVSISVEVWAAVRQVPAPRIPGLGLPQHAAAGLVTALALGVSATGPAVAGGLAASQPGHRDLVAATASVTATLTAEAATQAGATTSTRHVGATARPARADSKPALPTITTHRYDTLWLLAELHLGRGQRYTEIAKLNRGVVQPDGRSLGADGRIYPGWTLRLPADANTDVERPPVHHVVRGDTLWEIAEDELGDPTRYPEIYQVNRGDIQPGGGQLTDPDMIWTGWNLELPTNATTPADSRNPGKHPAGRTPKQPAPSAGSDGSGSAAPNPRQTLGADEGTASPTATSTVRPSEAASVSTSAAPNPGPTYGPDDGLASPTASGTAAPSVPASAPTPPAVEVAPAPALPLATAQATTPDAGNPPTSAGQGDDPGSPLSEALMAGIGAMALLGLVTEVGRRRRFFQRHRKLGQRLAPLSAEAVAVERFARGEQATQPAELLDRALRQLAHTCATEGRNLPDIRVIWAGSQTIELLHAAEVTPAVAPFVATAPNRWVLDDAQLLNESPDVARPCPALVTIGVDGESIVLVNMESIGTLQVIGAPHSVAGLARAVALDLSVGPSAGRATTVIAADEALMPRTLDPFMARLERDPNRLESEIRQQLDHAEARRANAETDTSSALSPGNADTETPPLIVLTDFDNLPSVAPWSGVALIRIGPMSDGQVPTALTLTLDAEGLAILEPEGILIQANSVDASTMTTIGELVDSADTSGALEEAEQDDSHQFALVGAAADPDSSPGRAAGDTSREPDRQGHQPVARVATPTLMSPSVTLAYVDSARVQPSRRAEGIRTDQATKFRWPPGWLDAPDPAAMKASPAGESTPQARRLPAEPPADLLLHQLPIEKVELADDVQHLAPHPGPSTVGPRILLLGSIQIEGTQNPPVSNRISRVLELLSFLVLHPDSTLGEVRSALFPGRRVSDGTFAQLVSRTRTWMGTDDQGRPFLPQLTDTGNRFRLHADVSSDLADFRRLASRGLNSDPSQVDDLRAALGLVRGQPFAGIRANSYAWADADITNLAAEIADLAQVLSQRETLAGRHNHARAAALNGLKADPTSDALLDAAIQASLALGDQVTAQGLESRRWTE